MRLKTGLIIGAIAATSWNDENYDTLIDLFCEDMRADPDFDRSAMRDVRRTGGELRLKIASLDIDGETATATILNRGEEVVRSLSGIP